MNICPVGADVFHANGQTDRHDETRLAMVIYEHIYTQTLIDCNWVQDLMVPMHLGLK